MKRDHWSSALRWMLNRRGLTLWTTVVVAVVVVVELVQVARSSKHSMEEPRILIAKRSVSAGSGVQFLDFTVVFFSELKGVPTQAVTDQGWHLLRGRRLKVDVSPGGILTWDMLDDDKGRGISQWIPKGYRAYSLITDQRVLALPGDRVDVVLMPHRSEMGGSTLVEAAMVLHREGRAEGSRLVLALMPADIERIEMGKRTGSLSIAIRNPEDSDVSRGGTPVKRRRQGRGIEVLSESGR